MCDLYREAPTLAQQGRISAGANTYVVYPGIDINPSGQIGMSYMKSGTDTATDYLSMWVTGRVSTDAAGTMQTPVKVPAGAGLPGAERRQGRPSLTPRTHALWRPRFRF